MLYKFKSKSAGDVIMLGPQGDQLLALLGKPAAATGIFECADMPQAIETLTRAVLDDEAARAQAEADARAEGQTLPPAAGVSLRQRVWPLIDMMKRSIAEGHDIVWGV